MRSILFALVVVAGCDAKGGSASPDASVAVHCGSMVFDGQRCDASDRGMACDWAEGTDAGVSGEHCNCIDTTWHCLDTYNSCPADFREPTAVCTPGTHCAMQDWEHGCDCACGTDGHWGCTPETIGSVCKI